MAPTWISLRLPPHDIGRLALPLLTVACGGGDATGNALPTAAVDTVAGVERYSYSADFGPTLGWTADTLFVLGDAFAEEEYQFNQATSAGLAAGEEGDLLVLDRQGKRVLRYGRDGAHRATYGREGGGPGELSQPLGIGVGPGDTIWVSDFSNSRLTGYPPEGGEPRLLPFPENSGFPGQRIAAVGESFVLRFQPRFAGRGDRTDEERPMLSLIRYHREDLTPRDTLWMSSEPPTDIVQLEMGNRLMVTVMPREFHPEVLWATFSDGGAVVSDTAAYVLHLVDANGDPVLRIERDPPPRAVTEADRAAARDRVREESVSGGGIRVGGGGPDEETQKRLLEQRLAKMTFAELVPRVLQLRVDHRDRIWVGVSEEGADELSRIDIFHRSGHLVGQLRGFPMPDVFLTDDRVAVLQRDDLDVQQLVVMVLGEDAG